uniref:PXCC family protein n=1 Tax=Scytodes thoracica TaxID=1112478 RepID=A0A0A0VC95_SCYTH|nr:PXCC family protein [Scytodes thoracica]
MTGLMCACSTLVSAGNCDFYGEIVKPGERYFSKTDCSMMECTDDAVNVFICGFVVSINECKLVEEKEKQYPYCCPHMVCPQG